MWDDCSLTVNFSEWHTIKHFRKKQALWSNLGPFTFVIVKKHLVLFGDYKYLFL